MKKKGIFFLLYLFFISIIFNPTIVFANTKLFIDSPELSNLKKIKNIRNKKEKPNKDGIFSYFLMKGLEGNADLNKDKTLTNGELIAYLKNNVSQEAFSQNRQQKPMLSGNPDNILIRY